MRWIVLTVIALLGADPLHADTVEPFGGEAVTGKVDLDFGGGVFRPAQGPVVRLDLSNVYRVRFENARAEECVPGVMLRDGTRLASPHGPLTEATVPFPKRNVSIPSAEIAWIVYDRFPAAFVANASEGQTGALLPGGDFFSGTVRGADAEAVKVFNSIFGLRRLDARQREVLAAVIRPSRALTAQYEFRTADGSLFGADNFVLDRSGVTLRNSLYDGLKIATAELVEIRAGASRCQPLVSIPQLHAEPPEGQQVIPDVGIVTDTKTVTTCPVPAGFTEFLARVAPGEDVGAGQRIVFTVYVNGTPIARSAPQTAGDPPQVLRVALSGARSVMLRVETGGPAAKAATGRWLQPLFLRR